MNIMERLGTKIGPLPVWAWGGIGAAVVWFLVGRSGTPNPLVSTQQSSDGGSSGGAGTGGDAPIPGTGVVGGGGGPPDPVLPVVSPSGTTAFTFPQDTQAQPTDYSMLPPVFDPTGGADPRNLFGGAPGPNAYAGPVDPFGFPMRTDPVVGSTPQPDLAPTPTPVYHTPDILPIPPEIQAPDTTGFTLPPNFTGTIYGIPYSNGQPVASLTAPSHTIDVTPTPNPTGWTVYPVTTAPVNPNPGWIPQAIPLQPPVHDVPLVGPYNPDVNIYPPGYVTPVRGPQ